jgi:TatD DNase family protein
MLFDTHTHLDDKQFADDFDAVVQRALEQGVSRMMIIACEEASSKLSLELSKKSSHLYCSIGVHPQDASTWREPLLDEFRQMIRANPDKIRAIGEIGLDYHYEFSPRDVQREVFIKQIDLAIDCGLPVIVHDREAHGDCLEIVQSFAKAGRLPAMPGVFHCYSGSYEMAKLLLGIGFYISFAGPITFKNAHRAVELLPQIPLDRLLIETDCPYLAPEPMRGHRNEPSYVRFVAEKVAELHHLPVSDIEEITTANACRLFGIT